ncbi:uncharacterized protein LOC112269228 [Brachypodium distachyon]|uniref:uncharacterized protein LOC112269228 n=1 Tax=Brachypodium distachyon TaxID=15368 RepID=UPI000D0CAB74|nr:uncharacterized protein LOC112269228 [Brachypodium distachyon]|eukprot:XP_024311226.1 uncharacterized protein LOC112269228 [Brachypodium distachyon]
MGVRHKILLSSLMQFRLFSSTGLELVILDVAGKRAVFRGPLELGQTLADHGRSKGFVQFVQRRDLEKSGCVMDGDGRSFDVRCTLRGHRGGHQVAQAQPPPRQYRSSVCFFRL